MCRVLSGVLSGATASIRPSRLAVLACLAILAVSGCRGYQVGHQSLFRPDVRTVHVPIFRSDTLRRNQGEWLTEAVVKEIESRTPYKVVGPQFADTTLSGRILAISKRVAAENPFDEPRDLDVELVVEVRWIDNQGNILMEHVAVPIESGAVTLSASSHFVPEGGQSMATAQQENIEQAAEQIVSLMEFTPL